MPVRAELHRLLRPYLSTYTRKEIERAVKRALLLVKNGKGKLPDRGSMNGK